MGEKREEQGNDNVMNNHTWPSNQRLYFPHDRCAGTELSRSRLPCSKYPQEWALSAMALEFINVIVEFQEMSIFTDVN